MEPITTPELPTRCDVVVVGAGLAGLAAAALAHRDGARVLVLDGQPAGGRARTDVVDGFRFNRGAHALYLGGHGRRVLDELGVPIAGATPQNETFGRRGDVVGRLPADARTMLSTSLLGWRGRAGAARVLRHVQHWAPRQLAAVTVAEWIDGMHLPPDAADLVHALVRVSSYGHAPEIMSAEVAAGQIQLALSSGVRYLDGGWQTMVDALASRVDVRRATVTAVQPGVVALSDGTEVAATTVIVATGAPAAAAAVLRRPAFECGPPIEASCLDLGTSRMAAHPFLLGIDRPLYLSTHHPPAQLAPAGHHVVSLMRYLAPGERPSHTAVRAELDEHARRAGISEADIVTSRALHRMVVSGALAVAADGGMAGRVPVTGSGVDGVLLAGDWVGGEGHLLDATLASARRAAHLALSRVAAAA